MKQPLRFLIFVGFAAAVNFQTVWSQLRLESPALLGKEIDSIAVAGNKITRAEIILREMRTKRGWRVNAEVLERDLLRIKALGLFSHVEFFVASAVDQVSLTIMVTEEWYIFPFPFWEFKDNNPDKPIYGFRYHQSNFRGLNETLIFRFWGGADRGFAFSHLTPWMKGTPEFSRAIEFAQFTTQSPRLTLKDLSLEERHSSAEVRLGRRWNLECATEIGTRFRLIQASNPLQLVSGGQLDRLLEAQISAVWDQRDLRIFPRRGFYLSGSLIHGWVLNDASRYRRLQLDARVFERLNSRMSAALRAVWQPSWGNLPPYDWIFLSAASPIRSAGLSAEGYSYYGASFETRIDLLPLRSFTWHWAPVFKEYFTNLDYGLSAEIFWDAGDVYAPGKRPNIRSLKSGYGAGLLLLLPYVDVLRLEWSWNPALPLSNYSFAVRKDISF